jgi:hypothetical protein
MSVKSPPEMAFFFYLAYGATASKGNLNAPLVKYIDNVLYRTNISHSAVFLALKYLYVLEERKCFPQDTPYGYNDIFVGVLMLADAALHDNTFTVKSWTEVSGIPTQHLVYLKQLFLWGLDFRLQMSPEDFHIWQKSLETWAHHLRDSPVQNRVSHTLCIPTTYHPLLYRI